MKKLGRLLLISGMLALSCCLLACGETAAEKTERLARQAEEAQRAAMEAQQDYEDLLAGYAEHQRLLEELDALSD